MPDNGSSLDTISVAKIGTGAIVVAAGGIAQVHGAIFVAAGGIAAVPS